MNLPNLITKPKKLFSNLNRIGQKSKISSFEQHKQPNFLRVAEAEEGRR